MPNFGDWVYSVDRDATIAAYRAAEDGGAQGCECVWCRNFVAARSHVFPAPFLALLDELGIDPLKDAEVFEMTDESPGRHIYSGWFHFVGTLERDGKFPAIPSGEKFSMWLCPATSPRLSTLDGLSVVQVEFYARDVPWLIPEPAPE